MCELQQILQTTGIFKTRFKEHKRDVMNADNKHVKMNMLEQLYTMRAATSPNILTGITNEKDPLFEPLPLFNIQTFTEHWQ